MAAAFGDEEDADKLAARYMEQEEKRLAASAAGGGGGGGVGQNVGGAMAGPGAKVT
jgi:hypothetical protein